MEWIAKTFKNDNEIKKEDFILYAMLLFSIGGFLGFFIEEIYCYMLNGYWSKRGFLYGPFIPIYGWGLMFITLTMKKHRKNPLAIFVASMIIAGVLEGLSGYVMYEIWNRRWWDYTGLYLNIGGFVCLRSVLQFGIGGLAAIYILEPIVHKMLEVWDKKKLRIFCYLVIIGFILDHIVCFIFKY